MTPPSFCQPRGKVCQQRAKCAILEGGGSGGGLGNSQPPAKSLSVYEEELPGRQAVCDEQA